MAVDWRVTEDEARRLRETVADAVVEARGGLTEQLERDPEATLTLVDAARVAAEETTRLLRGAIDAARSAGHSWGTIGELLGVSRQAAQQRFGGSGGVASPVGAQRVLSPVTAVDEMEVLEAEGKRGWHSVDYGTLYHVLEKSDVQWEHARFPWASRSRRRAEDEGWQRIGRMTFPWGYWARPTDRPALPDDGQH